MLNLVAKRDVKWSESLKPVGQGGHEQEGFEDWWARHERSFQHLHPQIVEQWVYRHWRWAHFQFLNLQRLVWSTIKIGTREFLEQVHLEYGGPADADHDYKVFANPMGGGKTKTAENWQDGTWTIPPLALAVPQGIISHQGELPDVRLVLVEGSLRYRWLHALHSRNEVTGPHTVFLIQEQS